MKTNKQIVASYYENLWNNKDKSYIDKLLHDNIVFRGSLHISTRGKKEFEEYFDMILNAIPNLYHGVEIMVSENNLVAARAIYNGTHQGKLLDIEPTNNRISYNGASFFNIKDGKIIDIWVLGDLNTLYKQLGRA
ncbi:ester cyclase [bacterium]|nr:ester cyclase [bacterium]MBU1994087.1 ester cyclase [bacterium]